MNTDECEAVVGRRNKRTGRASSSSQASCPVCLTVFSRYTLSSTEINEHISLCCEVNALMPTSRNDLSTRNDPMKNVKSKTDMNGKGIKKELKCKNVQIKRQTKVQKKICSKQLYDKTNHILMNQDTPPRNSDNIGPVERSTRSSQIYIKSEETVQVTSKEIMRNDENEKRSDHTCTEPSNRLRKRPRVSHISCPICEKTFYIHEMSMSEINRHISTCLDLAQNLTLSKPVDITNCEGVKEENILEKQPICKPLIKSNIKEECNDEQNHINASATNNHIDHSLIDSSSSRVTDERNNDLDIERNPSSRCRSRLKSSEMSISCPVCLQSFRKDKISVTEINEHILRCSTFNEKADKRTKVKEEEGTPSLSLLSTPSTSNDYESSPLNYSPIEQMLIRRQNEIQLADRKASIQTLNNIPVKRSLRHILMKYLSPT